MILKIHIKLILNQWNQIDHLINIEINLIVYLYIYNISQSIYQRKYTSIQDNIDIDNVDI